MSNGKFGLKMPINNYNPRMSDAWNTGAAIGNLLGTLWGENYQKRGEKKTYEAAQEILNNMGKQEPASDSLYQDYSNLNGNIYQTIYISPYNYKTNAIITECYILKSKKMVLMFWEIYGDVDTKCIDYKKVVEFGKTVNN